MALTSEKTGTRRLFGKRATFLMFQEVMNRFPEMLTQRMLQHLFLKEIEITCSRKRELN